MKNKLKKLINFIILIIITALILYYKTPINEVLYN